MLEVALVAPYLAPEPDAVESVVITASRHAQALDKAHQTLRHALETTRARLPGDFIAIDVRGALDALGEITGETVTEEIVHRIFQDFCVGK
jgi:tRNA modification GTPase